MSSHHIVREKQEPALYIHNPGAFSEEYLGQLLEWSPTLIVNGAVYEKIISMGLKVDVVINAGNEHIFQENTKTVNGTGSNLNAVLDYLIAEKYPAVNIIDAGCNFTELTPYISEIDIVVFTETEKMYAIKPGFKVWRSEGSVFKIEDSADFEPGNLKQQANGSFVVVNDGFITFNFNKAHLFISEVL